MIILVVEIMLNFLHLSNICPTCRAAPDSLDCLVWLPVTTRQRPAQGQFAALCDWQPGEARAGHSSGHSSGEVL